MEIYQIFHSRENDSKLFFSQIIKENFQITNEIELKKFIDSASSNIIIFNGIFNF